VRLQVDDQRHLHSAQPHGSSAPPALAHPRGWISESLSAVLRWRSSRPCERVRVCGTDLKGQNEQKDPPPFRDQTVRPSHLSAAWIRTFETRNCLRFV
jgi:hypothetical protein